MSSVKTRLQKLQWIRIVVQLAFFLWMPSLFSQTFSGVKEILTNMGKGQPLQISGFVLRLFILSVITVLAGRIFCGWLCAFGAIGDWIYLLSSAIQKKSGKRLPTLSEKWQIRLQKIKYIVLSGILLLCFLGYSEKVTKYSPWTVFSLLTEQNLQLVKYGAATFLLVLILLGMMWQERFFCQFFCPLGAIFSLLPRIPVYRVKPKKKECLKGCKACTSRCPVRLKFDEAESREGECISCGRCFMVCPQRHRKEQKAGK